MWFNKSLIPLTFSRWETIKQNIISKPGGLDVETNRDRDRERP